MNLHRLIKLHQLWTARSILFTVFHYLWIFYYHDCIAFFANNGKIKCETSTVWKNILPLVPTVFVLYKCTCTSFGFENEAVQSFEHTPWFGLDTFTKRTQRSLIRALLLSIYRFNSSFLINTKDKNHALLPAHNKTHTKWDESYDGMRPSVNNFLSVGGFSPIFLHMMGVCSDDFNNKLLNEYWLVSSLTTL